MGEGTVKKSLTVGNVSEDSPSLRDALEYELNMIESSIDAFENEVEALKALIDWHVSVSKELLSPKESYIASQIVSDINEVFEGSISALYSGDDVCETGIEWSVEKGEGKTVTVRVYVSPRYECEDLQWEKIFKEVGENLGECEVKHLVIKEYW